MTMLSVAGARTKARTRLNTAMAAWAAESVDEVRVEIALHPPTEKQVLADQAAAADWAASWRAVGEGAGSVSSTATRHSDSVACPGLEIDWEERSWARIGRQRIPVRLRLVTPDAVASFVGGDTARDWRRLRDRAALLRERFRGASSDSTSTADSAAGGDDGGKDGGDVRGGTDGGGDGVDMLAAAIRSQSRRILGLTDASFTTVVDVVDWLSTHRLGSMRPRQLPIRGVDSKWFETHRSLVTALLGGIGHADAVSVLDAEPRLRLRILDPGLLPGADVANPSAADTRTADSPTAADRGAADRGVAAAASTNLPSGRLDDITGPISQLSGLPLAPRLVFVFENLESVLAMPTWPGAVAVHGSGYAVDQVARLDWIAAARVLYWGDLDSHGFAILNRLRSHLPEVESVLMDEATLLDHRDLWVAEPKPSTGAFTQLTGTEVRALDRLRSEGHVRLEQERIPWQTALDRLRAAVGQPDTNGHLGAGIDAGAAHSAEGHGRLGEGPDDHR